MILGEICMQAIKRRSVELISKAKYRCLLTLFPPRVVGV